MLKAAQLFWKFSSRVTLKMFLYKIKNLRNHPKFLRFLRLFGGGGGGGGGKCNMVMSKSLWLFSHLVILVELAKEVYNGCGDDGVDTDEEIDANITNKGHLCILEYRRQKIHPGEGRESEKKPWNQCDKWQASKTHLTSRITTQKTKDSY